MKLDLKIEQEALVLLELNRLFLDEKQTAFLPQDAVWMTCSIAVEE